MIKLWYWHKLKLSLLREALAEIQVIVYQRPQDHMLAGICLQLQYLIDLKMGNRKDQDHLDSINVGTIGERELDGSHPELQEKLYKISNTVAHIRPRGPDHRSFWRL